MKYIKTFSNHSEYEAAESGLILPNVSLCVNENEVHYNPVPPHDYSQDYFTTIALEDGTITFNIWSSMGTDYIISISYSTDNGETWTTTNNVNNKKKNLQINVDVNNGDKVLWKGNAQQLGFFDDDEDMGSFFSSDCEFNAEGNVMSLLYGDNFYGETTLEETAELSYLFSDYNENLSCNIVDASKMILPATTLAQSCYQSMFFGCRKLTTAPVLSATTLTNNCYAFMFQGCTSLTTAPSLPATTLANYCYQYMFNGCTSLTTAPVLSATTLAERCYFYMFGGCTSLTTAPELPATALANDCYQYMFRDCTSLTTAPVLSATTLATYCYSNMFNGCTSLNYIKAMFTTTPSASYMSNWVYGVASSGTFVKNSAATWTSDCGESTYPCNWTVETASS